MKTIRQQLTRKLLLGFTLLLGIGGASIYFSTRAELLENFDDALRAKATVISTLTKDEGSHTDVDFPDRLMRGFNERVARDFFEMWDANGIPLERSESLEKSNLPRRVGEFEKPEFWNLTLPSGFAGRAMVFTFTPKKDEDEDEANNSTPSGKVLIVVASDRRELDETLDTLALVLSGTGALLLVATALVVPRVLRQELSPLNQLANQAAGITADSLASRFPTESWPGELTPISGRLNDLLERLEQSFERERRFSADLAHELRTPIAELRSLAELALKWPDAREVQTDREVLGIAVQMQGMVTRLLALLRSERGLLPVTRERIALTVLVDSIWKCFAERAADKQLNYACHLADHVEIETDPVLLRSILTNLLDNAVEYAPRRGMVRIDSGVESGRFTLRVTNTAEHLTPEDATKLFDRFWRKDAARSNNEHSGLGLSLSRAFAQALGYKLTVALVDESRIMLTLSGPIRFGSQVAIS